MSTNTTPEFLRGFLLPLDMTMSNFWTAQSIYNQQSPIAGDPVPAQNSPMRLSAIGPQTDNSNLTIKTRKGGYAGFGAGFTFLDNQETGPEEYGRDAQNSISEWENIKFSTSSVVANYLRPSLLDAKDGDILIAYEKRTGSNYAVRVSKRSKSGAETDVSVFTDATLTKSFFPVMTILQDGTYILLFLDAVDSALSTADTSANIRVYSSNDGTTWTLRSRRALNTSFDLNTIAGAGLTTYQIQRLRLAQCNGNLLLLFEVLYNDTGATKRNRILQYASSDNGATIDLITTAALSDTYGFRSIALYAKDGQYSLVYAAEKNALHYMRIPSPYTSIHVLRKSLSYIVVSADTVATGTNTLMTGGDIAAWSDEEGSDVIMYKDESRNGAFSAYYSSDSLNWFRMGGNGTVSNANVYFSNDDSSIPTDLFGCSWTGRSVVVHTIGATANNFSLGLFYLGGYTTVTLPETLLSSEFLEWNRCGYSFNFVGFDLPSNIAGLSVLGAGAETLNSGGVLIGSGQKIITVTALPTFPTASDYVTKGLLIRTSFASQTGGSTTGTPKRGISMQIDSGAADYDVELRVSQTQILVYDNNASATVGTITATSTNGIDLLIHFSTGKIIVYYRLTSTQNNLRKWTQGLKATGLSDGGGSSAGQTVKFGHLIYSTGTLETVWTDFHVANGAEIGAGLYNFDSPDDLIPRPYPQRGKFAWTTDNVRISATDGPTYEGDSFGITQDSLYPVSNVLHSVSPTPRIGWRSTAVSAGANIPETFLAWKLDADTSIHINESLPNDMIALHLEEHNFKDAKIEYYASGSWTVLHTFSASILTQGNSFGRTLRGVNGAGEEPYFLYNECKGWKVYIDTGGETGYVWREIVSNSEGLFGGTATGTKQAVLMLDESVVAVSNATIYLIPNKCTVLFNLNGLRLEALGLRITAQSTYNNDFRIGHLSWSSCVVPGKQYQRGRSITIDSGTEQTESRDGIRFSRNIRPSRRRFRLSWTEGIDVSSLQGLTPDPDYWKSSSSAGSEPIAIDNDVPSLMQGVLDYLKGSLHPIVYIPNISKSTDLRLLLRQQEHALCTLEGDVSITNVLGNELQTEAGEVFRVAAINLLEIV